MKRKIDEENNEESNKKQKIYDTCPICLEDIKDNNFVVTKCNHKFCFSCLAKSCHEKNNCPLCRAEIEYLQQKKLPEFKNINLFDNICDSFRNPFYNIFQHIDVVKKKILDTIHFTDEIFNDEELEFKELILDKLKDSDNFVDTLDISLMDDIQLFINNIIIRTTFNTINWYKTNY